MADMLPVIEAVVVRPGDHLIVRCHSETTLTEAAEIKAEILRRLPDLDDVTVLTVDGLYVFRDADHG